MRRLTGRHPSKSDAGGGWPVFILQMMDRGGRDYRHWQRPCESGSRYCEKKSPTQAGFVCSGCFNARDRGCFRIVILIQVLSGFMPVHPTSIC